MIVYQVLNTYTYALSTIVGDLVLISRSDPKGFILIERVAKITSILFAVWKPLGSLTYPLTIPDTIFSSTERSRSVGVHKYQLPVGILGHQNHTLTIAPT